MSTAKLLTFVIVISLLFAGPVWAEDTEWIRPSAKWLTTDDPPVSSPCDGIVDYRTLQRCLDLMDKARLEKVKEKLRKVEKVEYIYLTVQLPVDALVIFLQRNPGWEIVNISASISGTSHIITQFSSKSDWDWVTLRKRVCE